MTYVLYSLYWIDGTGYQPYEQVAAAGASLDGGQAVHAGRYLGVIAGSDADIQAAIDGCARFAMQPISEQEAQAFTERGELPVSVEDRLKAAEDALLELMLGG